MWKETRFSRICQEIFLTKFQQTNSPLKRESWSLFYAKWGGFYTRGDSVAGQGIKAYFRKNKVI